MSDDKTKNQTSAGGDISQLMATDEPADVESGGNATAAQTSSATDFAADLGGDDAKIAEALGE
ncbi:hypothetical protein AB0F25_29885 [Streptomyces wedmorensis]|uniref:hypothetical protein n=1 Tax=Streptomyces wedmorensis TaxID=43759 RepID=UPI00343A5D12